MNGPPEYKPEPDDKPEIDPPSTQDSAQSAGPHAPGPEALEEWTPEVDPVVEPAPEDVSRAENRWEDSLPIPPGPPQPPGTDQPMFQQWYQPPPRPPVRIPHFGHLAMLMVFLLFGLLGAIVFIQTALHFHLFGVRTLQKSITDIHYTLGSEAITYLITFGACVLFFPMIWHKSFFAGVQWNGATALQLRRQLFLTAAICFVLALVNGLMLPGPKNAPIDKIFKAPGAAWMLFGFGVTFAPFFEEMIFRGFLLPALCTACDWIYEKSKHTSMRPLDENGQPRWSFTAMIIGSLATSIPFAAMHAAQTGYSLGPFILLIGVSMVLCWARLSTRSLAASVLVHASYNFLLFSLMMLGTSGFRHMDKM